MRSGGRPSLAPVQLKEGFYIEVCDKGAHKGMKIWNATEKAMLDAASLYSGHKTVVVLGRYAEGAFKDAPQKKR